MATGNLSIWQRDIMRTYIDETEVKRIVNLLVKQGTPRQIQELTKLIRKKQPSDQKNKSLRELLIKYQNYLTND